ncbi:6,7,8-trihydroxycoumarin synthase-like [Solanum verrucosum]|uniref:6,7,8-trihydroxycoumarin synthase-like n=1 Tax=Solanum verrucosum TaxID=315347 RepID=UPI0020D17BF7|nr:6,7,8-trihydroxycoumarin synthase-like [Solanum verrucosum]
MIFFLFSISLPIILIFLLHKTKMSRKTIVPPGPLGLPFIGNLHQFDCLNPRLYFWKLSQKYGKIFSLKIGSVTMVVISSAKLAKEVTQIQDLTFCSRPSFVGQQKVSYNGTDICFSPYNDYWREIRKICVVHLFSLKKVQLFRPIREDEVSRMIKKISQQAAASQITNLSNIVTSLTSTMICRYAFGIRYDEEAHEKRRFDEHLAMSQEMAATFFVSDNFPLLGWMDKLTGKISRLEKNFKILDEFYQELIDQHHNPNRPKSMEGDIIDILLELRKEQSTPFDLTLDNIKAILTDIFFGGTETSAVPIIWAMTMLIKNPKAMKKVQKEIRKTIGNKGIVNEDDVQNMPYLKAVIKETFRLYPPSPLLMPRESIQKSTLEGYEIQPKTVVYVNTWMIGRDPEIWENPEEFIPERFLNSDIDYFKGQNFELIPFGAGRRGCPAVALGVATVNLILPNLLYAFDWELPYGIMKEDIDTTIMPGLGMHKKNDLCLVPKKYPYT